MSGFSTPLTGDLAAIEALTGTNTIYYRSGPDTWSPVVIGSGVAFSGGILTATGASGTAVLRGYIDGLSLSTAGASSTFSVAAGVAADSGTAVMMALASSLNKTTAAWTVGNGNGALDTGTIANNTWYHVYEIMRTDGTIVDVLISLSAAAPTMPTNYSYYRQIGSMRTNGSGQWMRFIQDGDRTRWATIVNDVSVGNPGTAAVTRTLTVPTGVRVLAEVSAQVLSSNGGTSSPILLSDLLSDDTAVAGSNMNISGYFTNNTAGNTVSAGGSASVMTNTSAQIRSRLGLSAADTTFIINTIGWIHPRGRVN